MTSLRRAFVVSATLLLAACESGDSGDSAATASTMALAVPPVLDVRAVNPDNLAPRVLVNGQGIDATEINGQWEASLVVEPGSDLNIEIIWIERVDFRELRLADVQASVASVDRNQVIRVSTDDYETDRYDADFDGISNLAERIGDSDPFDASDPGNGVAQVDIPFIDPAGAPTIDGIEDFVWSGAAVRDRDGALLQIDNLMIDQGATRLDGDTEYRWKAMHDGVNLYLLIFGEGRNGQTPFGDSSPDVWNDDSIDVFWDPDNSKLSAYDGIDDSHFLLPLLQLNGQANRSGQPGTRFFIGFYSVELDESATEFVACPCPGSQAVWEIRMNLEANRMALDTVIGFEIQLGDDNNGGAREAKWGWFHPSRTTTDVDNTARNPAFMSSMRLVPSLF